MSESSPKRKQEVQNIDPTATETKIENTSIDTDITIVVRTDIETAQETGIEKRRADGGIRDTGTSRKTKMANASILAKDAAATHPNIPRRRHKRKKSRSSIVILPMMTEKTNG